MDPARPRWHSSTKPFQSFAHMLLDRGTNEGNELQDLLAEVIYGDSHVYLPAPDTLFGG